MASKKKRIFLFIGTLVVVAVVATIVVLIRSRDSEEWLTFEECENSGGMAIRSEFGYTNVCPDNTEYTGKIEDASIEFICCEAI